MSSLHQEVIIANPAAAQLDTVGRAHSSERKEEKAMTGKKNAQLDWKYLDMQAYVGITKHKAVLKRQTSFYRSAMSRMLRRSWM